MSLTQTGSSKSSRFFLAFSKAIHWNALFFIFYKVTSVGLTLFLYKKLPSFYFSQWATINSVIFLILLWLGCGFKKSIPRFSPAFSKNSFFYRRFIQFLLLAKLCILAIGIPIVFLILQYYIPHNPFNSLIIGLFVTEGCCNVLLLVYHAHFWQKELNLVQTFFLILEMSANFLFLSYSMSDPITVVQFLLTSKIFGNIGVIFTSLFLLPYLYKDTLVHHESIDTKQLTRAFIKHSCIMWFIAIVQSLSERNFLFPFITTTHGFDTANLFKVVNDGAIFFQRIIVRTIGVTDTTFLSYLEVTDTTLKTIKAAFVTIYKTIIVLSAPLLCIGVIIFFKHHTVIPSSTIAIFLILAITSALEIFLSPYSRVLEVKLKYKEMFIGYSPYIIGYIALMGIYSFTDMTLLAFVSWACLLRITSTVLFVYFAKRDYGLPFPAGFTFGVASVSVLLAFIAWMLL